MNINLSAMEKAGTRPQLCYEKPWGIFSTRFFPLESAQMNL